MKKFSKLFIGIAAAFLAVFAGSCEIGLGEAVDTAAPTITIAYPEQSSVIRDTFIMAGECEDDMGVTNINIKIYRTDTGKSELVKTFNVSADNENKCWQAEMNLWLGEDKGYNGWELCDGKYVADVVASDESGRVSGTASLSFDIDNTAPIFILKNPTSENLSSPSAYGTTFKVAGTLSDDHTVSTMTIKIYDANADFSDPSNPPVPLETVVENNVDVTTEILVANYNKTGELKDRYLRIYDGTTEGENKNLVCTINVQDNAKEYKNPSEKENTTTGNSTNNFYITDKVSSVWTSGDMDPGRVKKVVNRTATNVSEDMTGKILNLYNTAHSDKSYFYINSDANPTYEISGYGVAQNVAISKLATTSATLSFNLTYGRNQDNIDPSTVKVFLWGPFEANDVTAEMRAKMYSTDYDVLYSYYQTQKTANKARVIAYNGEGEWEGKKYKKEGVVYSVVNEDGTTEYPGYDEGSKDYLIQSIEIEDTIIPNKLYYISAYSEDLMGASSTPKAYFYAFKGQSTGAAPTVKWVNTSYGTNAVENQGIIGAGAINFYGYVEYPDGTETKTGITYKAERTDANVANITGDVTELFEDTAERKIYWKFTLPGITDSSEVIQNWRVTVSAGSTNAQGVNGEDKRSFTIDTKPPVINLKSLNPFVLEGTTKYLNGNITVEGSLDEKNPSKLWYEIKSNGVVKKSTVDSPYDETVRNINVQIDTTNYDDEKSFEIIFYAEDKAGNRSVKSSTTQNGNAAYIIKQSTDKPKIVENFTKNDSGTTKADLDANAWYGKDSKLNFSLSDDDGIKSIEIWDGNTKETGTRLPSITSGTTNTSINYLVPQTDGIHEIKVIAVDTTHASGKTQAIKDNRTETWGPFAIGVDTANPTVTDEYSKGTNYYKKGSKADLKGTAYDANLKEISVVLTEDVNVNPKTYTYTYSPTAQSNTVGYNTTTHVWSVDITDKLDEGTYKVETTVTDYAGKTAKASSRWVVDTKEPTVNASITTTPVTFTRNAVSETWYNTLALDIEATATDDYNGVKGSGISDVQYSLDGTNWISLTYDSTNSKWTKKVTCTQGENKIYIKAIDKVDLEKSIPGDYLTVNVDTEAPSTFNFVSLNNQTEDSGLFNGTSNIPLVVEVSDTLTDVKTVKIKKIGDTSRDISYTSKSENEYTFNIDKNVLKKGDIIVEVCDNAGNSTSKKVATVNIDNVKPVINSTSVSPIVTRKSDSKECINGTVKISGKITENNLNKVWYKVYSNGNEVTYAADQTLNAETIIDFSIDTTKTGIENNKELEIKIWANDKAGNEVAAPASIKYMVDQSTDNPVITPNNFTVVAPSTETDKTKAAQENKENTTSWFNGTPIIGNVTDDDNVKTVSIVTKDVNGTTTVIAATNQTIPTFTYDLPVDAQNKPKDGVYQVTITATDDTWADGADATIKGYRQTVCGPFLVGVDTANPTVTEAKSTGKNYTHGAIDLSGTASDLNGIKTLKVEAFKDNANTATKTYTWSASANSNQITYNSSTNVWSYTIVDGDLPEGEYKIKTTATDYANKSSTVTSTFVKDKTPPTITPSITTTVDKTESPKNWYKTTTIGIKVITGTDLSGIKNVQYSLDSGLNKEWTALNKDAADETLWTANVKCAQGENVIYLKATDKSGLENTSKTLTAWVDTEGPATLSLYSVDSDTSFSGTKLVNGNNDVVIVVSAAEATTGIGMDTPANGTVAITKIGTTTLQTPIKAASEASGKYTITIPKAQLATGNVIVTAKDKLGNTTVSDALFKIDLDNTAPEVSISSVTPIVSKNSKKYVNGTIKISGKANDLNLNEVWYTITKNGTEDTTKHTLTNGVEIELDTTATGYSKDDTIDVTVYANDKAGNSNSAKASNVNGAGNIVFTVDQDTDIPEVSASNITYQAAPNGSSALASSIAESDWFISKGDNKVLGTVSDDDILKSVTIVTKNAAGTSTIGSQTELIEEGSTASSINFSYALPAADGVYQVTIVATDDTWAAGADDTIKAYRKKTYGPFVVGVDKNAPTITETKYSAGTNYIASGTIVLGGSATDTNGIKQIEVKVVSDKDSTTKYTYTKGAGVTLNEATGVWSSTIPAALAEGKYTATITATDYSGKTAVVERKFVKDNTAPSISGLSVTSPAATTKVGQNDWYNTTSLSIQANVSDATCDVTEVLYSFNQTDWTPLKQDSADKTKWTASVVCPEQGANTIYVKATDEAAAVLGTTNHTGTTSKIVYADSLEPAVCEVVTINGNAPADKLVINSSTAVTLVVKAQDSTTAAKATGLKAVANGGVKVTKIGTTTLQTPIKAASKSGDNYTITIPANSGSGAVTVQLEDMLGKTKEFKLFTIEVDSAAPETSITPLSDADTSTAVIDVNGDITITGSSSDNNELVGVNLYYAIENASGSEPAKPATADLATPAKWNTAGWTTSTLSGTKYSWTTTINTANLTDTKKLYFYAVATDRAGNVSVTPYSTTEQLYINQDSDRPKITFTSLELTKYDDTSNKYVSNKDSTDNYYWHTSKTLQGSVSDDDGTVTGVYWKKGSDGTWSSNIYSKGSWIINDALAEGKSDIYFKVTDAADKDFISAATGLKGPKIYDSNDQECLGFTGKVSEILPIKVDTVAPSISSVVAYTSDTTADAWDSTKQTKNLSGIGTLGGSNTFLFVKITSVDDNGISSVKAKLNNVEATSSNDDAKVLSSSGGELVVRYDLTKVTYDAGKLIEDKNFEIEVVDNSTKTTTKTEKLTLDFKKPAISFTTRDNAVYYASISNTIIGRTTDGSQIKDLYYKVTNEDTQPTIGWAKVAYSTESENQIATDNWSISFDGEQTTKTEYHTDKLYDIYKTNPDTDYTDEQLEAINNNVPMYLWMYAEDSVGNASDPVKLTLSVILNADKPSVEVTYPSDNATIGGVIRVTGITTILKDSVEKVYVQIDPSYNTSFDNGWATELQDLLTNVTDYSIVDTGFAAPYDKGILASGTTGWGLTLNAKKEFNAAGNIGIRAFAVSQTKHRVSEFDAKTVTIDSNVPVFGNDAALGKTGMRLVKYNSGASGTIASDQNYKDGMSIKGNWYLVGSISDESGISKATVKMPGAAETTLLVDNGTIIKSDWVKELSDSADGKGKKNFYLNIPVGTTDTGFGTLEYEVYIYDNSENVLSNNYKYTVTYDNEAPKFSITSGKSAEMVQSNGTYTIAGTFNEDPNENTGDVQSGFERIVMFITKTKDSKTYVVDPMISNGTTGIANREEVSSKAADGLYWRTATINKVTNGTMTVSKFGSTEVTEVTPKVRAGGLCKVDGVIYRIKYANGTTVTLDDVSVNSATTSVQFAIGALVIDNPIAEGGNKTAVYNAASTNTQGKDSTQTEGDGDQMMETATTVGSQTNWSVSIDSTQILDGEVKVNFVAYDKAGNITEYYEDKENNKIGFTTVVKNNAPRLVGVKYGSDLNNDGEIKGTEWNTNSADLYVQVLQTSSATGEREDGKLADGTIVREIDLSGNENNRITIKNDLAVIPQIVGGNLGLDWQMTYLDNSATPAEKTTTKATLSSSHSQGVIRTYGTNPADANYTTANDANYKIYLSTLNFLQLNSNVGIARGTSKEKQVLTFTISDKHEDGDDSIQSVSIKIPVKVLFADGVPPTATIRPFHWNSSSDNSLYNNSKAYGHIELPGEWTDTTLNLGTDDPKVSGIITFEGVAKDNVLVNVIQISVNGGTNWTTIAERNTSGAWTSGTNNANLLVLRDADEVNEVAALTYNDYFTSTNNQDWYFELISDETDLNEKLADGTTANPDYEKNIVNFKFHWNTRKLISTVTQKDVLFQVQAKDKGSVGLNADNNGLAYSSIQTSAIKTIKKNGSDVKVATSTTENTGYYKMDVVPYVAHVYTELAARKKADVDNWSNASRTSSGHYPVRVTTYDQSRNAVTGGGETISFYGFNLAEAKYGDNELGDGTQLTSVSGVYDVKTLNASLIASSQSVALTVGSINTINNVNNNDAKGSYSKTLGNDTYAEGAYNRQPNTTNNVKLTDDLYFDVWQVNEGAARSAGRIEQPQMKVDPVTGKLGFAFVDGTFGYSMAGTTNGTLSPSSTTTDNYSNHEWIESKDFCTSAGFAIDSHGRTWGVTAGNESGENYSDYLVLVSSMWGKNTDTNYTFNKNSNHLRLERTAQSTDTITNHTNNDKQRVKSPSIATAYHQITTQQGWSKTTTYNTNVYLAYYDNMNDEIRVKYGSFNSQSITTNTDMVNIGENTNTNGLDYATGRGYCSVVAGGSVTKKADGTTEFSPATNKKAGEYVSIAVISDEGSTIDDKLVMVWYDGETLWYSSNASPYSTTKTYGNRGSWTTPVRVFASTSTMYKAGEYCKVTVDKKNGVHIAAYDSKNLDLCYAYLPGSNNGVASAQTDFVTCVVDAQGVTGSNLNIDVALDGTGNTAKVTPHISYYSSSLLRAKEAYYVGGFTINSTSISSGVDDTDAFTGAWEVSAVPTRNNIEMQSNQHNDICIGLWKNSSGVLNSSQTGTNAEATTSITDKSTRTYYNGTTWGNGTANPAVGYVTQVSSTKSCIEVAQKN